MTNKEIDLVRSKTQDLKLGELAQRIGLSYPTMTKFLNGDDSISLKNSYKICKEIGVVIRFVEPAESKNDFIHRSHILKIRQILSDNYLMLQRKRQYDLASICLGKITLLNDLLDNG